MLRKELNDVFLAPRPAQRAWAVDWDESAIDFLLSRASRPTSARVR